MLALAHVSDHEIYRAQELQRALERRLRLATELPIAQLARVAADDYRREFGHRVSDRHLRTLIETAIANLQGLSNQESRAVRFRCEEISSISDFVSSG